MPSVLQQVDRDADTDSHTLFFFSGAYTAGSSVYVLGQAIDTTSTLGVSDDHPNTFSLLTGPVTVGTTRYWLWRAANVAAGQPSTTLTISGSTFTQWVGWEVTGDDASNPIDTGIVGNSANDASPTSGVVSVANAGDLVLAALWTPGFGRSATLSSSFTHIEGATGPWGSVGYKTEPGTSFTETGTISSAVPWVFIVIPVQASSGGTPATTDAKLIFRHA